MPKDCKDGLYWGSTRGLYFLTGSYLVAMLYDRELAGKFLLLIVLLGGILIGITVTEAKILGRDKREIQA